MSQDAQLERLWMQWEQLCAQGQIVSVEELCAEADCHEPEIIAELDRRVQVRQSMDPWLTQAEAPRTVQDILRSGPKHGPNPTFT